MSVLHYVHRKRDAFSLSLYLCSHQGSTPSLPNLVTYPLYFSTANKLTSRPSILAWALDSKNTDLYYCKTSPKVKSNSNDSCSPMQPSVLFSRMALNLDQLTLELTNTVQLWYTVTTVSELRQNPNNASQDNEVLWIIDKFDWYLDQDWKCILVHISSLHLSFDCFLCRFSTSGAYSE